MRSQVSPTTRDGGGRLASGAAHSSSQRPTIAPTATSGGSTASTYRLAAMRSREGPAAGRGTGGRASAAPGVLACELRATTFAGSARGKDLAVELIASARALDREASQVRLRIRRVEDLAVEERLDAARRRLRNLRGGHAQLGRSLSPQVLAIDLGDEARQVLVALELAPAHAFDEEPELVTAVGIGRVVPPELHDVRALLDDLAGAIVEPALKARQDVGHGAVEPLPAGDDLRELGAIRRLVAPHLRLLHRHEQRLRRVRMSVDPIGAHREALLGMLAPDLAGVDSRVTDLLILELLVPRLADTEAIHRADLHVRDHLRRRHDDRLDVFVGIDAAGREPVADPAIVRAARERHRSLDRVARGLHLLESGLERLRVEAEFEIRVFVADRDRLAVEVEAREHVHRRRHVVLRDLATADQIRHRR